MNTKNKHQNTGMATIELLIAFAILVINITAVILLTNGEQSVAIDTETNSEALYKAQELIEEAKSDANSDFNLANPIPAGPDGIYKKSLLVKQIDLFTKEITSLITWNNEGRDQTVNLTTRVTNPDAVDGGDTCSSVLAGDWTNPQKTEYEFGDDILNDTSSGFPITSIQSFNHKMYVTVNNDNGNNPGTFFILDITDPDNTPTLLSPPLFDNSTVGEGLNGVAVDSGNYAYVASAYTSAPANCMQNSNCAQLQVIDVSNPTNPTIIKNFKIQSITSGNKLAAGTSIFYKNGIVYLGLVKANLGYNELYIIDVGGAGGGSPTNPIILDSVKIDNGVNSIFVRGNYAYVASPNNQELKIFDVSNPSSISEVGYFDAPGGGANNGNGKSLYLVGDTLYLGRTLLNGNEFYVLDNSDSETSLPILGSKNIQNSDDGQPPAPFNTTVGGIIIRHNLAFLITNEEFQTWDISNPTNIVKYANPLILPPGTGGGLQGTASDCEGNHIFVGSQSSNDKGYISIITGS